MAHSCQRPSKCISGNLCENTKTDFCCWHEDRRKNKSIFYLDKYGEIDPTPYGITVPADIHYCPSCRTTKETLAEIVERLYQILPDPEIYHRNQTISKIVREREARDKLIEKLRKCYYSRKK